MPLQMGGKKAPPKATDEEKAAKALAKLHEQMQKAAKNDEVKKIEDAIGKGADIDFVNERGHTCAHIAAAFGALEVIRFLHKHDADFSLENEVRRRTIAFRHGRAR